MNPQRGSRNPGGKAPSFPALPRSRRKRRDPRSGQGSLLLQGFLSALVDDGNAVSQRLIVAANLDHRHNGIAAGDSHFLAVAVQSRPVGIRDGSAVGHGIQGGAVSLQLILPAVAALRGTGLHQDRRLAAGSRRGGHVQALQNGLAAVVVDGVRLLVEDEAIINYTTLASCLLPYRLFIPYFSRFPVSSAYIFTLLLEVGVGHSWERYILLSQVQLLRVTVSQSIWLCAYLGIPFNPCLKLIFCISTSPVYLMKQLVALLAQSYTIVNGKAFVNEMIPPIEVMCLQPSATFAALLASVVIPAKHLKPPLGDLWAMT